MTGAAHIAITVKAGSVSIFSVNLCFSVAMTASPLETKIQILVDTKEGQSQLDALSDAFKKFLKNTGRSEGDFDAIKQLAQDLKEGKVQADALDAEMRELAETWNSMSAVAADRDILGLKAHIEVKKEIEATDAAYKRLKESGKLTDKELAQAAQKTEERIRELKKQTNGWAESLLNAKAALAGLGGVGAGLSIAAGKAITFESAMADVAKVVDGTDEQMQRLTERTKELSRTIPLAAEELAKIAAFGGQMGVPVDKLEEFVRLASQMSVAFGMTAEEAGRVMAYLSNAFGLPLESMRELGDAINVLGNTTAATEASIVEVLSRVSGATKQFGLSAEQAAALGATMLSMGVSSQIAGTGINALLSKLQTANVQSADFQNALAQIGISAEQLAADIQANPQEALLRFLRTLEKVDQASRAEILSKLFGIEYQDDISRLLNGLDQYEQSLARIGNKAATAGAMQKEFKTRVKIIAIRGENGSYNGDSGCMEMSIIIAIRGENGSYNKPESPTAKPEIIAIRGENGSYNGCFHGHFSVLIIAIRGENGSYNFSRAGS